MQIKTPPYLFSLFVIFILYSCNNKSIQTTNSIQTKEVLNEPANKKIEISHSNSEEDVIIEFSELELSHPLWSPKGNFILTSGLGYQGLYVIDIKTLKIIHKINPEKNIGFGAYWSNNEDKIFFRERKKGQFNYYSYNLESKEIKSETKEIANHFNIKKKSNQEIITFLNSDLNISIIGAKGGETNEVKGVDKQNYYYPIQSPDKNYVLAHLGSLMQKIDLETLEVSNLVNGLANSISNDGKLIYYHLDESKDGHSISNSEIYMYNLEDNTSSNITNTADVIEMWPDISPDGQKIAYSDAKSGTIIIKQL